MRYNGRYEKSKRVTKIKTNDRKYASGSATIAQGDTIVHCAIHCTDTTNQFNQKPHELRFLILSAGREQEVLEQEAKNKNFLEQVLSATLLATEASTSGKKIFVEVVVEQDDGSCLAVATNALYLALQQTVDCLAMEMQDHQAIRLDQAFGAAKIAFLSREIPLVDPDRQEEKMAIFEATLALNEAGDYLAFQFDNKNQAFGIDEINGVLITGTTCVQEEIQELKANLYTPYTQKDGEKAIVIATNNEGKAREFSALFWKNGYQIKTLKDFPALPEVEETGTTFAENACLKAETIANILQVPVLADDSGLKVDALGGLPGVYSARFAGVDKNDAANNAKLLYELTDVPDEKRTAQFHCTLALAAPKKETLLVEAEWEGRIGRIPRGENGFGYDPLFVVDLDGTTAAELTAKEKNERSHRAKAIVKLEKNLLDWLEGAKE